MGDTETPVTSSQYLFGREEATLDSKFRVLIAKKKRDRLGPNFVLSLSELGCVNAHSQAAWNERMAKVMAADHQARHYFNHTVLANVEDDVNWDEQGRIIIPFKLRTEAKLVKDVVIIGCGEHVEIWDRAELALFDSLLARQNAFNASLGPR